MRYRVVTGKRSRGIENYGVELRRERERERERAGRVGALLYGLRRRSPRPPSFVGSHFKELRLLNISLWGIPPMDHLPDLTIPTSSGSEMSQP